VRSKWAALLGLAVAAFVLAAAALALAVAAYVRTPGDVTNGSVDAVDLAPDIRTQLRGERGAQGPLGRRGVAGIAGPPGIPGEAGEDFTFEIEELQDQVATLESRVDEVCSANLASDLRTRLFDNRLTWDEVFC